MQDFAFGKNWIESASKRVTVEYFANLLKINLFSFNELFILSFVTAFHLQQNKARF